MLWSILQVAFGVEGDQFDQLPEGGPVSADLRLWRMFRPNSTKGQLRKMLQNLLKERFDLVFHLTKKQIDAYTLVVAKAGPKLKPAAPHRMMHGDHRISGWRTNRYPWIRMVSPRWRPGVHSEREGRCFCDHRLNSRMTFRKSSPADLILALGCGVIPISDQTGLRGPTISNWSTTPKALFR